MADERLPRRERLKRKRLEKRGKRAATALRIELTVADRRVKAFDLKVAGWSLREIAKRLHCGLGTVSDDLAAVREELAEGAQVLAAKERDYSLRRIEQAIRGVMPRAKKGDSDAILSLDRMEKRRAALLGLDAPTKQEVHLSGSVSLDELDDLRAATEANGCSPPPTSPPPASPEPTPPSDASAPTS